VTAQAGRQDTKPALGEEVEKIHIPAPSALEGAVDKKQRVRVLVGRAALVDHIAHLNRTPFESMYLRSVAAGR
jgi:hypothetical protein